MKLIIVHSHFRPGGVRRIIELAVPHLVARWRPAIDEILLVGGEAAEPSWLAELRQKVRACRIECAIEPALGYLSEQRSGTRTGAFRRQIAAHVAGALGRAARGGCLVWAHNQGLGRNLPVTRELVRACAARRVPLVFHHHDWWFDNRWARWPEMRTAGFRTREAVAETILPVGEHVRHAAINRADAGVLERHLGERAGWVPNLVEPGAFPAEPEVRRARRWLADQLGDKAPVWLMPCRLLRRKNVAEALLLARWLRPGAWLVTSGGVSSAEEQPYARELAEAARRQRWRLRLCVLAGDEAEKPGMPALIAASEAVLLTSLQEGFGLPNVEAVAARRPLLARMLPNVAPDLRRFGFHFRHPYAELYVDAALFDGRAELRRQARRWLAWRRRLPPDCRALAHEPRWLAAGGFGPRVPFSRLTLRAQLEVLTHPPADSWAACVPLNPFLVPWRQEAAAGALPVARWPEHSARWLSGPAYVRALRRLVRAKPSANVDPAAGTRAMDEFIRAKLAAENQYPLLWTNVP